MMQMLKLVERELTKEEEFAAERFYYYVNGKDSLVIIGNYAVVIANHIHKADDLISYAKNQMRSIINNHPDFSSYIMDDGNAMIQMGNGNVFSVLDGKNADLKSIGEKVALPLALIARQYCLDAAEKGEVVAVLLGSESEE